MGDCVCGTAVEEDAGTTGGTTGSDNDQTGGDNDQTGGDNDQTVWRRCMRMAVTGVGRPCFRRAATWWQIWLHSVRSITMRPRLLFRRTAMRSCMGTAILLGGSVRLARVNIIAAEVSLTTRPALSRYMPVNFR